MKTKIVRIINNPLPGFLSAKKIIEDIKFIAETERNLSDVSLEFAFNKILDIEFFNKVSKLVVPTGCDLYSTVFCPRVLEERANAHWYLIAKNPLRNFLIRRHLETHDVVIVLDHDYYFKPDGWYQFESLMQAYPDDGYYALPVWKLQSIGQLEDQAPQLRQEFRSDGISRVGMNIPVLAFTKNSDLLYHEGLIHPEVDRITLMTRLGIFGPWLDENALPFSLKMVEMSYSKYAGSVKMGGYVCQLPFSNPDGAYSQIEPGSNYYNACQKLIDQANSLL